jgi:hypothetical protein
MLSRRKVFFGLSDFFVAMICSGYHFLLGVHRSEPNEHSVDVPATTSSTSMPHRNHAARANLPVITSGNGAILPLMIG